MTEVLDEMPFFYKTFVLLLYSIKMEINRALFLLSRLTDPNADESKWSLVFMKYIRIHMILFYFAWVLITVLLQIMFSYIPLPSEKLNVLLMACLLLGMVFIASYPRHSGMISYLLRSTLTYRIKKRLIVSHALLGSSVTLTVIILLLLPFLITQWVFYGLEGGMSIVNLLVLLLFYGIVVDFIKYLTNLYQHYQPAYTDSIIRMVLYVLIYYFTPEISGAIKYFIDGYILNLYDREHANLFLREVISKIPLQMDDLHITWGVVLFGIAAAACLIACMAGTSSLFFREVQRRPVHIRLWKTSHHHLSLFTHFFRKYGLFNHQIALILVFSFLLSYYFAGFEFYSYTSVLVPVFVLATSFFILEKGADLILLLKRYRMTSFQVSFAYSYYLFAQFLIYKFLLLLLSDGYFAFSSILESLAQSILGLILLYTIVSVYIAANYYLEGLIDLNVLHTYSKVLIYMYLTSLSAVIYIITGLQLIPDILVQLLIPLLILLMFVVGIQRYSIMLRRVKE